VAATLVVCLLGPITEEVVFRGLIFRLLRDEGFVKPGIIVSSVLFAVIHGGVSDALMAFPVGVALAWLYDQTGRLSAPLAAHILLNSLAVFRLLY
jgi:membrane protease YdiL (CAAX protease family)